VHESGAGRQTHFVDDRVNEAMADDGYAVLPQRLPAVLVDELTDLYAGVVEESGRDGSGRFRPSMMIPDSALRTRLWDGVRRITAPVLAPLFRDGTTDVLGGSFVSKPSSPESSRNPHQDPTVFDETQHVSISVWIPLSRSTVGNGTLYVLPGSHLLGNHVRPPDVDSLDDDVRAFALGASVPIELEPGEMLVIDGALIHHSPPNESGAERVATICAVRPAGAEMLYVRSEDGAAEGVAEVYGIGVAAYRSGEIVEPRLDGVPVIRRAPYRPVTMADVARARSSN